MCRSPPGRKNVDSEPDADASHQSQTRIGRTADVDRVRYIGLVVRVIDAGAEVDARPELVVAGQREDVVDRAGVDFAVRQERARPVQAYRERPDDVLGADVPGLARLVAGDHRAGRIADREVTVVEVLEGAAELER